MKNKKLVSIVSIILLLSLAITVLVACDKDKKTFSITDIINPEYEAETINHSIVDISQFNDCNIEGYARNFLLFSRQNGDSKKDYILYNLESNLILHTYSADSYTTLVMNSQNNYYVYIVLTNADGNTLYEYYDHNSLIVSVDSDLAQNAQHYSNRVTFANGDAIYIEDNEGTYVSYSINPTKYDMEKVGENYIYYCDNWVYVYDLNMNLVNSYNINELQTKIASYSDYNSFNLGSSRYIQLIDSVDNDTDPYNYMEYLSEDTDPDTGEKIYNVFKKYNYETLVFNHISGKINTISQNYIFSKVLYKSGEKFAYNIVEYYTITSGMTKSAHSKIGVFDDNGNLLYDLSQDVTSIKSIDVLGTNKLCIIDNDNVLRIYENGNLTKIVDTSKIDESYYNGSLTKIGNKLYDKNFDEVITLDPQWNIMDCNSTLTSKIYYYIEKENEDLSTTTEYYVYDINSKTSELLGNDDNFSFNQPYIFYTIRNEDTISIYHAVTGQAIFENKSYTTSQVSLNGYGDYLVIVINDADGNTYRYAYN